MLSNFKETKSSFVFENSKISYLKILTDNGLASILEDGSIDVPFENLYELNDFERKQIGLPSVYPFEILVEHRGIFCTPDFKFEISFRTFAPGGSILPKLDQKGPVISLDVNDKKIDYLLSSEQFRLVRALFEFNELQTNNRMEQFKRFSEIKELSKISASMLDQTLIDRIVVMPQKVCLNVSFKDGELDIVPSIGGECNDKFVKLFEQNSEVRESYSFGSGNSKTFVVLSPAIHEEFKKIKKARKVKDPQKIQAIINNPEKHFDPEITDLSEFYSDRVIGKGLYQPKVYPFISPYQSQWIPTFLVEDHLNGTSRILIENLALLEEFMAAIEDAKRGEKDFCEFAGTKILIDDAVKMVEFARKQLEKKEKVADEGPGSIEEKKKEKQYEVLLIEQNIEETGFTAIREQDFLPKYLEIEKDSNLKENFELKEHQVEGIAWLQNLVKHAKGGLLADDMGLGKTLQVLYLLDWDSRRENKNKPYLIVAPVSLLENWCQEYKKFFKNGMQIEIVEHIPKIFDSNFVQKHSFKHIMVVGYETMRRGQFSLAAIDFSIIVLDEAQKVKVPGTMVTSAVKALKSDFRLPITGTPVENTYMDLWCIMDFAVPGLLGNAKTFAHKYQEPLKIADTDLEKLGHQLRLELGGYFLRRLKSDVSKDLPQKHIEYHKVKMPEIQYERYVSIITSRQSIKLSPLETIHSLRKISDHPYLGYKDVEDISAAELIKSSAKLEATIKILEQVQERNEKAIIFTDCRDMQRMLRRILFEKFKLEASIINGDSSAIDRGNRMSRQRTVDKFQEKRGFNVIIMSQLAAGVGLNVVGANHVIHYSRHWNPAKEMQATDRVYRIGQEKEVFVHFPMAVCDEFESFDVILDNLLQKKTHLASASLYPTERIEVFQKELSDKLFGNLPTAQASSYVSFKDLENMDEYLFESFVAVYYRKQEGFECYVTAKNGDKGVDVLAFNKNGNNYAIQCKHSRNNVDVDAMEEVLVGSMFYKQKYGKTFKPVVLTNNFFASKAIDYAQSGNVLLVDGNELCQKFKENCYRWEDVYQAEANRIKC